MFIRQRRGNEKPTIQVGNTFTSLNHATESVYGLFTIFRKAAPFPTEITDKLGRAVKLDGIPQRIVSLTPSNTEILFALDLAGNWYRH